MAADVQSGAAVDGSPYIAASTNPRSGSCIGQVTPWETTAKEFR